MADLIVPIEALMLMFVLGLRHGLDPDHIAMVDALAYGRSGQVRRAWSTGVMFAAGHGAAVTLAAVLMQAMRRELAPGAPWDTVLAWLPIALLTLAGSANLRALLRPGEYRPAGIGRSLLGRIGARAQPLAAFGIGVLFALVFDTAAQIAALAYAGNAGHGPSAALLVGLAFTAGMIVVDALDGYLMARVLANGEPAMRERYRRVVGWVSVTAAYGVAAYGAASSLWPQLEVEEAVLSLAGAALIGTCAALALWTRRQARKPAAAYAVGTN